MITPEEARKCKLPVIEIFTSVQGEGMHMGRKATFIRLAGCNLACPWCDTKSSWSQESADVMSIEDIENRVKYESFVVITGGEPTIHKHHDLAMLVESLHEMGCTVAVETNGTNEVPGNFDWITCSPKPPLYKIHPSLKADELKFVVTEDFKWCAITPEMRQCYANRIWLQPDGTSEQTMKASWKECLHLVESDPRLRIGVQLHKIMDVQ